MSSIRKAANAALDSLRGTAYPDGEKIIRAASRLRISSHVISEEEAIALVRSVMEERESLWPGYDTTTEI